MEKGYDALPGRVQDGNQRLGCQHVDRVRGPGRSICVPRGRPTKELGSNHDPRSRISQHERTIGQIRHGRPIKPAAPSVGCQPLGMELHIHRVGADMSTMKLQPERLEANVVLTTAERTRPMAGGERGRLVEEEELCEPAGLEERSSLPAAKLSFGLCSSLSVTASVPRTRLLRRSRGRTSDGRRCVCIRPRRRV